MSSPISRVTRTLLWRLGIGSPPRRADPRDADLDDPRALLDHQEAIVGLGETAAPLRESPRWRPPRRVVVTEASSRRLAWLAEVAPAVDLHPVFDVPSALRALRGADALIGWCTPAMLSAAPDLQWLQCNVSGVDGLRSMPGLRERGITVTNVRGVAGPVIAEHAIALLLALSRNIPEEPALTHRSIHGLRALVAGYGGIGRELVPRAAALGMRVEVARNNPRTLAAPVEAVWSLSAAIASADRFDVVFNALPHTPATSRAFGAAFFERLPSHAYFINVGRGATVDHVALAAVLMGGRLSGVGLDVTDPEPLPRGHALRREPRVIITSHTASNSVRSTARMWGLIRENLRRYVAGDALLAPVDLTRGY